MKALKILGVVLFIQLLTLNFHAQSQKSELYVQTGLSGETWIKILSPDGKIFASVSDEQTVKLFDVSNGAEIHTFFGHNADVTAVAFSPDSKILATGGLDGKINLWNITTRKKIPFLDREIDKISAISFSPNGKFLAIASWWGTLVWDLATKKLLHQISAGGLETCCAATGVAFTGDSKYLIIVRTRYSEWFIDLLNISTGSIYDGLSRNASVGASVKYLDKTKSVIIQKSLNAKSKALEFYPDVPPGLRELTDAETKILQTPLPDSLKKVVPSKIEKIHSIYLLPDDKTIIARKGKTNLIWNLAKGEEPKLVAENSITPPNFLVDKNKSANLELSLKNNDTIVINNSPTEIIGEQEQGEYFIIAISKDGKKLATFKIIQRLHRREGFFQIHEITKYDDDSKYYIIPEKSSSVSLDFELELTNSLKEKNSELLKSVDEISAIVPEFGKRWRIWRNEPISNDEKFQAKLLEDGTIQIINPQTAAEICRLIVFDQNNWAVVTPDGLFDGSPNAWKQMIWRLNDNTFEYAPVEAFFKEFYYPGLLQEIMQGKNPKPPEKNLTQIDIRQPNIKISEIANQPTNAANALSTDKRTVSVKVEITDNAEKPKKTTFPKSSGAQDLRLFRNGSLIKVWEKDVFKLGVADGCKQIPATVNTPRKAVCQTDLTVVAGKNEFSAYAFNHDNVKSGDATAAINGADVLKRQGTMYVLAVGVNEYAAENGLDEKDKKLKLKYAVSDVEKIGKEIATQQENQSDRKYVRTEIITLTDARATKSNVLKALRRFALGDKEAIPADFSAELKAQFEKIKKAEPEDALIIYFAGHGVANEDRFYLVSHDGAPAELVPYLKDVEEERQLTHSKTDVASLFERLFRQSISDEELENILRGVDAGKMLMVIDACNSGQALDTSEEKRRGPMNSKGLAQLAYEKGMYILTASESRQAALEAKKFGHGLLTFALLEGMKNADANRDKNIIDREWLDFAVGKVPQLQAEVEKERLLTMKKIEADKNAVVEKKQPQTPRVFYRRELDINPLIMSKSQ